MTAFDIYLVMQLDSIIATLGVIGGLLFVASSLIFVGLWAENIGGEAMRMNRLAFRVSAVMVLAATMIPSSKTLAMMYVIPAVVNNEKLSGGAKEVYGLAKEGLKKLAEDK